MDKVRLVAAIVAILSAVNLIVSGVFGLQLFADGEVEAVAQGLSILIVTAYGIYLKLVKDQVAAELKAERAENQVLRSKK
jgi:arginine exporter protein ArgO